MAKILFHTIAPSAIPTKLQDENKIVLIHGFTQNAKTLTPFARLLAKLTNRPLHLVDLPGHNSQNPPNLNLREIAEMLGDTFGSAVFIGYSLGGRIAYHIAIHRPEAAAGLIAIGANPGLTDSSALQSRRESDEKLALSLSQITNEAELRKFLMKWLSAPIFGGIHPDQAQIGSRLVNEPIKLAQSLKSTGLAEQSYLLEELASLKVPFAYLYGQNDAKFGQIGHLMKERLGDNLDLIEVASSGHYLLGERPYECAIAISQFLTASNI